jgi:uncharacterized membrane protein YqjE
MTIDEQVESLAREVRELTRLHGELARVELQTGARRLVTTLCLMGFGVIVGMLVLFASGVAAYLLLAAVLPKAAAAALVAFGYLLVAAGSWWLAWRLMRGASGVFLPQTRQMLSELMHWRDNEPTSS